jgi:hypothetical protein
LRRRRNTFCPASYGELGRAIAREARAHDKRIATLAQQARTEAAAAGAVQADVEPVDDAELVDDSELGDEDLEQQARAEASAGAVEADGEPIDDIDDEELGDDELEEQQAA